MQHFSMAEKCRERGRGGFIGGLLLIIIIIKNPSLLALFYSLYLQLTNPTYSLLHVTTTNIMMDAFINIVCVCDIPAHERQ